MMARRSMGTCAARHIYTILQRATSADEQLQVWRDTDDIKAVMDRVIERTMENLPCGVMPGVFTAMQ